jgi:predicted enzyme related to lactoylglutathione lyase
MGNPFVHLDLATTDLAAAKQFYKSLFDWKFEEMPAMEYVGIVVGDGVGGGMGKVQGPDQPASWTAFVDVKDLKATIAKAESLGARILEPYMPIGDMGWLGVLIDPQGATIGVWQAASPPPVPKKAAPAQRKAAPAKKKAAPAKKKPAAKKPAGKKKR